MSRDTLTIGMAMRGEPDHVWFVLQALHAYHPRVSYLVVDNSPERSPPTEAACNAVGGRYLHRPDLTGTSAPRDAVFRFAGTPWAMCVDSHVFLEPGAVRAALDYIDRSPDSADLIQGPMVHDDGVGLSTHWRPEAPPGLWGVWDRDPRGTDSAGGAFEIPMMGLGLWMMRTAAWPGFNSLNRGFGGEEGIIHETVRRRGGKCLCLPALRWRHKFRDRGGWHNNAPPPYPLSAEDHVWNLLIGHRELEIEARPQIRAHFAKGWPDDKWDGIVRATDAVQPLGSRRTVKRQRILALWYSDNTPSPALLERSARSVVAAADQALRHDVTVSACSWSPIQGNPFGLDWRTFGGEKVRGYATIVKQIHWAAQLATAVGEAYDAVAFCEHDVLYPPGYFDRLGDALAANPDAPVASHLDYIGLNATGWQKVKERHEPLHQLCLRWDVFRANLARAEEEAKTGRPVVLEPDHNADRSKWARISPADPSGMSGTPSVHVNHTAGRFTSHGDVCYESQGVGVWHPHWGEARQWWPGQVTVAGPDPTKFRGEAPKKQCGACAAAKEQTLEKWYKAAAATPSDFHEHMETLRALAAACGSATELSWWGKPADAAMALGVGATGRFTSVAPNGKSQWAKLGEWFGNRFSGVQADPHRADIEPTDLLFVDTQHTARALYGLLEKHAVKTQKYIVVHCTETFGETGDVPNEPGVLHALRRFCHQHPEWVVKRRDRNNHGLMVLSRCPEDVKEKPSYFRQAMNYTAAMAKHVANGRRTVPLEVLEARQAECALCEERALDACAACGCPLEAKLPLASEQCGMVKKNLPPKWDRYEGA